jgi:branched-chain amino acid transport system ATP-binding protein
MTLRVENLSARYGSTTVLRDVHLEVRPGQVLALIGANGVGKSTLLNSIAGLHRTASGAVSLDGSPILGKSAHRIARLGLALVPEGRHLFGELTVSENLTMGMHGLGYSRATAQEQTAAVFEMFPILADFSARRAGLLSGGQQQMLAIGRALVRRPKVLLLDEPSLGLAPLLVQQILATVQTLASGDVAVILAEQNAAAALRVADRGVILDSGRVVREDRAGALLEDELVSQHYLGGASEVRATGALSVELPPELRTRSLGGKER